MLLIVHRLPSGEYVLSMYAHLDQVLVSEGQLVYPTTQIGTVGDTKTTWAHLHWEIRKESFLDLTNSTTVSLKDVYPYGVRAWPGTDTQFIADNYCDPTDFIKSHSLVGMTNPNQSSIYQAAFEKGFVDHGGHVVFGQPDNTGVGATYYVYTTSGSSFLAQDFRNGLNGFASRLMRNQYNGEVYPLFGAIGNFWNTSYDTPFTSEIVAPVANSPDGSHVTLAPTTIQVVGQKFGDPDDHATRKTIMHNPATGQTVHLPMGVFHIGEPNQSGEQWYIQVGSNPADDIPWPAAGFPAPTGDWWTKAGVYQFVTHDSQGGRIGGFTVHILEGNNQFADPNTPPQANPLAATGASVSGSSSSHVTLVWSDPNSPDATPYQVNRNNVAIGTTSSLSFTDNTVQAGQTYTYTISANGAPESGSVVVTTSGGSSNNNPPAVPGQITVLSPNGGEYTSGAGIAVTWSGGNSNNFSVQFSRDNGATWDNPSSTQNATSLTIYPSEEPQSDHCLVKVYDTLDPDNYDVSDAWFSLGNTNKVIDLSASPYASDYEIRNAANGALLYAGTTPTDDLTFAADSVTVVFTHAEYASSDTTVVLLNHQPHHQVYGDLTYNGSNPLGPVATSSVDTVDFGETASGLFTQQITVTNVGTATVHASVRTTGAPTVSLDTLSLGIDHTASITVSLDFDPLAPGSYVDSLIVEIADGQDLIVPIQYVRGPDMGAVVFSDDYERSSLGSDYDHTGDAYITSNKLFVPINNKVVTVPAAGNPADVSLVFDWWFSASSGDRKFVMWTRRQASGYSGYQSDQDGYQVVLKRDSRKVIFAKWVDGVEYNMGVFTGFNPDPGRYHLSVTGNTLQFTNEPGGTPVSLTVVDTGYGGVGALPAGAVGFQQNGDNCTVDNLDIISEPGSMQNGTILTCDPPSFDFGETDTTTTISVESSPTGVDWSISYTPLWLTTDVSTGTTTSPVVLSIDRTNFSPGTYSDTLRFVADDSLCALPVSMTVPVDNAALFSDDFSAGLGGWTTIEGSVPTISGGELYFNSPGAKSTSVVTTPASLSDAVITFDWRSEGSYQGNDNSMIYLRLSGNSHLKALIKQDGNSGKKVVIISQNNGVEKGLATQYIDLQPGRYRFSVFGSTATFEHVSGNPGSAITLTATDALIGSLSAGSVGLGVGHEKAYYDNVVVGTEVPLAKTLTDHDTFNDATVPTAYALEQNYPNPFNPSTNIRFAVPVSDHVSIAVYDLTGRLVQTLVNTELAAGVHTVTFDGRDLTSGLYFVRMRSASFHKTIKMTLLK